MELREMVRGAATARRAHSVRHLAGRRRRRGRAAKAKGLEAFPYAKALEALDLILSAGLPRAGDPAGCARRRAPDRLRGDGCHAPRDPPQASAGADRITVLSSTLEPETLSARGSLQSSRRASGSTPRTTLVGRAQVLAGTALTSVIGDGDVLDRSRPRDRRPDRRGAADRWVVAARCVDETAGPRRSRSISGHERRTTDRAARLVVQTYANLLGSNAPTGTTTSTSRSAGPLPGYRDLQLTLEALTGGPVEPPPGREPGLIGYWQHEEVDAMTTSGEKYMQRRPAHPNPVAAAFVRETALGPVVQSDRSRAKWRGHPGAARRLRRHGQPREVRPGGAYRQPRSR